MTEFTIKHANRNLAEITRSIESFGNKITILWQNEKRIKIETDQATADELASKTGVEVDEVRYASLDMGMQNTFMRTMAKRLAGEKKDADISAPANPAAKVPDEPTP